MPPRPVLVTLALVVLAAGYAALARGSTSVAPALLVAAYCVLVPLAILRGGLPNDRGGSAR